MKKLTTLKKFKSSLSKQDLINQNDSAAMTGGSGRTERYATNESSGYGYSSDTEHWQYNDAGCGYLTVIGFNKRGVEFQSHDTGC